MSGMRLPLVLAFLLAALLSLVNVSAYKQATVTDSLTMTVTTTGSAALALNAGAGNAVNQVSTTSNGVLRIDFRRGYASGIQGFQTTRTGGGLTLSADIVRMRQVFTVTNNGGNCQNISVYVSGGTPTNLVGIYGRLTGGATPGTQLAGTNGVQNANRVKLGTTGGTDQMVVDFWWQATSAAASTGNFTIRVAGTKSATCP